MGKEETKNLATSSSDTALSTEMLAELSKDAGAGLENIRPEDLAIPFLTVLQKMSPQVDPTSSSYVPDAKIGQLLETGTQTLYDEAVVIPCHRKTAMVEWHPLESGGGFVAQHEVGYELKFQRDDRGNWQTDAGTILVQTMYYGCLLMQASGDPMPVLLRFKSSQLKRARTWNTQLTSRKLVGPNGKFTPPIYERSWKLTSVLEKNEKGSWSGIKIEPVAPITDLNLIKAARAAATLFANSKITEPAPVTPSEEAAF